MNFYRHNKRFAVFWQCILCSLHKKIPSLESHFTAHFTHKVSLCEEDSGQKIEGKWKKGISLLNTFFPYLSSTHVSYRSFQTVLRRQTFLIISVKTRTICSEYFNIDPLEETIFRFVVWDVCFTACFGSTGHQAWSVALLLSTMRSPWGNSVVWSCL